MLVSVAFKFGAADICSLMFPGLLAGSTLARGSLLKGVLMTALRLLLAMVGADVNTGQQRFTFGLRQLYDGVEIVALALGVFAVAEFLKSVNYIAPISTRYISVRLGDLRPNRAEAADYVTGARARSTIRS